MLTVKLPDGREYKLAAAVFDYNGTLAEDGDISPEIKGKLAELARFLQVTVITADTFGSVESQLEYVPGVKVVVINDAEAAQAKAQHVISQGAANTVAVGNGVNDKLMFEAAELAICVMGPEGASVPTLMAADIAVSCPEDAVGLLLNPKRIVATLRR